VTAGGAWSYPPRQRRRSRRKGRALAAIVVVGAAFALGVALGQALHDNPHPGGTRTFVRTLRPLPLPPSRVTVTVTSSAP
jgi:hypothetical protein